MRSVIRCLAMALIPFAVSPAGVAADGFERKVEIERKKVPEKIAEFEILINKGFLEQSIKFGRAWWHELKKLADEAHEDKVPPAATAWIRPLQDDLGKVARPLISLTSADRSVKRVLPYLKKGRAEAHEKIVRAESEAQKMVEAIKKKKLSPAELAKALAEAKKVIRQRFDGIKSWARGVHDGAKTDLSLVTQEVEKVKQGKADGPLKKLEATIHQNADDFAKQATDEWKAYNGDPWVQDALQGPDSKRYKALMLKLFNDKG